MAAENVGEVTQMNLQDIGKQAAAIASIVTVAGFAAFAFNYFQTDAEAQQYQQQHAQELSRVRVQMLEQKIQELRYQLLSSSLSPEQREWIYKELQRLEEQVKCIREGKC